MFTTPNRRRFMQVAAASSVGGWELLKSLPAVTAADAKLDASRVQMQPEIEPLVQLLENTDRDKLLEEVAARIRSGTSYQAVLTALLLAGVRNIQPRPSVGFKFHAVLVVNSAHIASLASADEQRWLPIFWALDEFKSSQAQDVREGDWTMGPVNESAVPRPSKAAAAFTTAMDNWDVEAADAAVAGLARGLGSNQVFELFCRYAARDYRSIGHKAIYLANSWRTLNCIGWQHAEPVLRSLAYAMLNHSGEPNPAKSDLAPDRPWRHNEPLAKKLDENWLDGKPNDDATKELLIALREAGTDAASDKVVEFINRGVAPQSMWDATFLAAGELLARQPGIVPLHAMTTSNAVHYLYQTTRDDNLRRRLLLQNAAFITMFRDSARGRGRLGTAQIDHFSAEDWVPENFRAEKVREDILRNISENPRRATTDVMNYLHYGGDAQELIDAARLLVFFKGNNAHDYKFSSAVLEDYYHVSPSWRDRYLAASVFNLRGSGARTTRSSNGHGRRWRRSVAGASYPRTLTSSGASWTGCPASCVSRACLPYNLCLLKLA